MPVAEPRVVGAFYWLDEDTEGLRPLERQVARAEPRSALTGTRMVYTVDGARSPVRLPQGRMAQFVYTVEPGTNPRRVQFVRLQSKKTERELLWTEARGTRNVNMLPYQGLQFTIEPHGKMSFKVIGNDLLSPGEYALSMTDTNTTYCFGVDGSEPAKEKDKKKR